MGKDNVQKTLKEYFEDLYNVDRKEQFAVNMFGFDSAKRGTFLEGEPIRKDWSGDANGKLENAKGAGNDDITRIIIKSRGEFVIDWVWKLCNMTFGSGAVRKEWKTAVIVPLYKGKGPWM